MPRGSRGLTSLLTGLLVAVGCKEAATEPVAPEAPEAPVTRRSPVAQDDLLVVLNKAAAQASLVSPESGKTVATVSVGHGPHEVAVSPDGRTAVVTNYGTGTRPGQTLSVVDLQDRRVTETISLAPHTKPHGIAWLPDAEHVLVTTEGSRAVVCVDIGAATVDCVIETDQDVSHMLALAPDGRRAYVANIGSGTMTAIDVSARAVLEHVETGAGAEGIAVLPDGSEIWVTNREADTVAVVDAEALEVIATLKAGSFPIRAEVTSDGSHVLVSNARSGSLSVFDAQTRTLVQTVDFEALAAETEGRLFGDRFGDSPVPIGIELGPAGRHAYVAHANADVVTVVDLGTWEVTRSIAVGEEPDGMAYARVNRDN